MTDSGTFPRDKPAGLDGRAPIADPAAAAPVGAARPGQDVLLATHALPLLGCSAPRPNPLSLA
jgi:hypothetical protein